MTTTYQQLVYEQRRQIPALKKSGCSQREIAEIIGTSQSTVSRELAKNTGEHGYRHRQAQGRTDRRRTESARASRMSPKMITVTESKLRVERSQEQILGWLLNDQERLIIPVAFQVATLLAAFAHPDHLLLVGSRGFAYLLPSINLKCFWYKRCVVTLVERKTGYTLIGQLNDITTKSTNRRTIKLMSKMGCDVYCIRPKQMTSPTRLHLQQTEGRTPQAQR
ncbi:MAG: helix-turn-helix domain-containing protein [Candidatus Endonucleobacter sp. (ex Gigantidas childressi)]|nr:helix-turn-helix domain-containing protein [Candidatus Endonucleobacter sp. (ex Gigantidas childressi)]